MHHDVINVKNIFRYAICHKIWVQCSVHHPFSIYILKLIHMTNVYMSRGGRGYFEPAIVFTYFGQEKSRGLKPFLNSLLSRILFSQLKFLLNYLLEQKRLLCVILSKLAAFPELDRDLLILEHYGVKPYFYNEMYYLFLRL